MIISQEKNKCWDEMILFNEWENQAVANNIWAFVMYNIFRLITHLQNESTVITWTEIVKI